MKVYHKGFNLYQQFPKSDSLVEKFNVCQVENLRDIEVNHTYAVLLVADTIVFQNIQKRETLNFKNVQQISSNNEWILALLENELLKIRKSLEKIDRIPLTENIIKISCGDKMSIAISENGVFNIPTKLDCDIKGIVDVKTGREHCLLLDDKGNVYSFGRGSRGQLGHGVLDDEIEPKFIEALGGIKIEGIATGGWHSCALSKEGDLYTWGWNANGQLGLAENSVAVMATPVVVNIDKNVSKVACGNRHTVFLLDNNELHGCGWNKYKQLSEGAEENLKKTTYLHDFSGETVKMIKCGPWSTVVLCE